MRSWNVLLELISANGYKSVAEVGVCKGKTALNILQRANLDSYYAIDLKFHPVFFHYLQSKLYPALRLFNMDSALAASQVPDNLDLVFIDAWHDRISVTRDIVLWLPKLREGGILCGHDYDNPKWPEVKPTVDMLLGEGNIMLADVKGCKVWIYYRTGLTSDKKLIYL